MVIRKRGELMNVTRHSVSGDGKTLTVTENGLDGDDRPVHDTKVYSRQ